MLKPTQDKEAQATIFSLILQDMRHYAPTLQIAKIMTNNILQIMENLGYRKGTSLKQRLGKVGVIIDNFADMED
jgi:hypothetical protein